MYKCTNCPWEGEELSKLPEHRLPGKCPICGDEVTGKGKLEAPKNSDDLDFDINNDGKVDNKDIKAMAKKLGSRGGRPKKSKKRK